MGIRKAAGLLGHGVEFEYDTPSSETAYSMLRLFFASPLTMLGFASLHTDKSARDGDVELKLKHGLMPLFLFPWLTMHEVIHILAVRYSRSQTTISLSPFLLHIIVSGYLGLTLFLALMFRNPYAVATMLFMITQQIVLLLGCWSDWKQLLPIAKEIEQE